MTKKSNDASAMAAFAAMLDDQETKTYRKGFNPGERVQARVLSINDNFVVLDVGSKNEGLLPATDIIDDTGTPTLKPGDTISAIFVAVQNGAFMFTQASGAVLSDQLWHALRYRAYL